MLTPNEAHGADILTLYSQRYRFSRTNSNAAHARC